MLRLSLALSGLLLLACTNTGCIVHGRARVGGAVYAEPAMVEVSPGVMVIEDYDDSVFYSDGFYWRYNGGVWMRSSYHNRGWVTWRRPPARIVSIRNPRAYVRYRGRAGAVRVRGRGHSPAQREYRQERRREERRDDRRRHHH